MLKKVSVKRKIQAKEILGFLSVPQKWQIAGCIDRLKNKKIVHVNATARGGGVAEILQALVPYSRALGIESQWCAIGEDAGEKFFHITDKMRDGLQGKKVSLTGDEWNIYKQVNEKIAQDLQDIEFDILVLHDWQTAFAGLFLKKETPKIFVSHLDTSSASANVARVIAKAVQGNECVIFSNKDFVLKGVAEERVKIIAPAIDPLSLKQKIVPKEKARVYLAGFGIPAEGSLIVQVSRFDIWKNPRGVIEAFHIIQKKHPKVSLALVGIEETQDNPNAKKVYRSVKALAKRNPRIFLFFDPKGIPNIVTFTMMAQNAADIVVQNSTKEGFGLTVAEAMWKEKPVIGGPASGIKRQIVDGVNGFIAKDTDVLARRVGELMEYPENAERIAHAGKASARKHFLMPRLMVEYARAYQLSLKSLS